MENGSNTPTTSVETVHGEKIEAGKWISWRRKRAAEKRRFGKTVELSGDGLSIFCVPYRRPERKSSGKLPDTWGIGEFEWAVAEGRIPADSIWTLGDKLASHELDYIRCPKKFQKIN